MTPNKKVIETYLATTDLSEVARLLTDDAEWIEWFNGAPAGGARSRGKAAYIQNFDGHKLREEATRMTEENNVVVAEGTVRAPKKDGGFMTIQFCDIFELESGKVKRNTTFAAVLKDST